MTKIQNISIKANTAMKMTDTEKKTKKNIEKDKDLNKEINTKKDIQIKINTTEVAKAKKGEDTVETTTGTRMKNRDQDRNKKKAMSNQKSETIKNNK